jgi:hypothetical protein
MIPRALRFPVMAMARPARPTIERALVIEAARVVERDNGLVSASRQADEVARRVIASLRDYAAPHDDPIDAAFARAELALNGCPFARLASDDTVNLYGEATADLVARRADRGLEYFTRHQHDADLQAVFDALRPRLAARYLKHLRKNSVALA